MKLTKIIPFVIFFTMAFPLMADERTEVNDENVCWLLKRAVQLSGSDVVVTCPTTEDDSPT